MISLKQLVYALAVADTLHFKKAADRCAVSQSALSTAINELESRLGLQLFERDNKKVLLTTEGRLILDKARDIKIQVDELQAFAASFKAPLSTPMTLGVIPTIGPYLLPRALPAVRKAYPDFKLSIVEEQSQDLLDKVRRGDIDAAILALPYDIQGLLSFEFWEENFVLVAHSDSELANLKQISTEELKHAHLLLLKEGHCLKDHALAACKLKTAEVDHSLAGTSLHTLVQMVAGRMGLTLIPEMAVPSLLHDNPELKTITLADPGPHRSIALICRLNYAGVNNLEVLKKLFIEGLKQKPH